MRHKYDGPTFRNLLTRAKVGEEIVYHKGPWCDGPYANDAWKAYEAGMVVLYQRRSGAYMFEYCAKRVK
jgi:hypothetical protein